MGFLATCAGMIPLSSPALWQRGIALLGLEVSVAGPSLISINVTISVIGSSGDDGHDLSRHSMPSFRSWPACRTCPRTPALPCAPTRTPSAQGSGTQDGSPHVRPYPRLYMLPRPADAVE